MADHLRSISTKIFGIALGLLLVMLIVSWWSASAIHGVNRQLRTLGQSLVPMALELQDMRHAVDNERLALGTRLAGSGDASLCSRALAASSRAADFQLDLTRRAVRHGQAIAQTERNRLELARLVPMIEQLDGLHEHHRLSAIRLCNAPDDVYARQENAADARSLMDAIDAVSDEVRKFALATAKIVESRESGAIRANLVLIAIASIVGLSLAYFVSRGLTRPIVRLREGTRAVEAGRLDGEVPVTTRDEVGDVTRAFNEMLAGLRAKEQIKETFGQYVDPRVVNQLLAGEAGSAQTGAKQVATLFFSDIAGFTALSEILSPTALVTMINEYFSIMSGPIRAHEGIIDKYIGDSIMAFWVPPFVDEAAQAILACQAAIAQRDLLPVLNARLPELLGWRGTPAITSRMSVTTGEVVVGSIGPQFARSFTVMGDTVNLASRLEGTNKVYGTRIIVDAETVARTGQAFEVRPLDMVQVVGREEPREIFELMGAAGCSNDDRRTTIDLYGEALACYRQGDWSRAEACFAEALRVCADDGPSAAMLARIRGLDRRPPAGWNGVWRIASK